MLDAMDVAEQRLKSREQLAIRLAQECWRIIQGYLCEEEWQDADHKFLKSSLRNC